MQRKIPIDIRDEKGIVTGDIEMGETILSPLSTESPLHPQRMTSPEVRHALTDRFP